MSRAEKIRLKQQVTAIMREKDLRLTIEPKFKWKKQYQRVSVVVGRLLYQATDIMDIENNLATLKKWLLILDDYQTVKRPTPIQELAGWIRSEKAWFAIPESELLLVSEMVSIMVFQREGDAYKNVNEKADTSREVHDDKTD